MNRVILIGNLTRDPERRTTRSGVTTCSFTLAVERDHKDKDGNRITDYITVIAWRNTADLCCRYLTKGRQAAVIGSWHNRQLRGQGWKQAHGLRVHRGRRAIPRGPAPGQRPRRV